MGNISPILFMIYMILFFALAVAASATHPILSIFSIIGSMVSLILTWKSLRHPN